MRVGVFCESGWSQELKLFFMAGLFQILLFYRPVLFDEWICIVSKHISIFRNIVERGIKHM